MGENAPEIMYDEDVLEAIKKGAKKLTDTVAPTIGPKGKNVLLGKVFKSPQITNDGAYIVREIEFEDENAVGTEALKMASISTSESSGDGTTTSALLAGEILNEAIKSISAGHHPTYLRRGLQKAQEYGTDFLRKFSTPVEEEEDVAQVATVSADRGPEIGNLIAEAIQMVGKDGVVQVEESDSIETYLEFSEGMQLDRGYLSEDFLQGEDQTEIDLKDPFLLMADDRLTEAQDVLRPMEWAVRNNAPLFVMAHDVEDQAKATLVQNAREGKLECVAIKAPRVGEKRFDIINNVAILTNGAVVADETGYKPHKNDPDVYLGRADSIKVDRDRTTIIGGQGDDEDIEERIKALQSKKEQSGSEHDREFYQQQQSQMSGGIAILRVGGKTETELKEKKADVEDALSATRSAIRSGIVPGGGATLIQLADYLDHLRESNSVEFSEESEVEERQAWKILSKALRKPFKQIVENGAFNPDVTHYRFSRVLEEQEETDLVFDVTDGEIKDAFESGILNPEMVAEDVLQNAISVASTLFTARCMIISDEDEDDQLPA